MRFATYFIYGLLLLAFLIFGGFAMFHALRHEYVSPRVKPVTWIFVVVSLLLIAISFYFLITLDFS